MFIVINKVLTLKNLKTKLLIIYILSGFLLSCVGTVKDKNSQAAINQSSGDSSKVIFFEGLTNATAISHDKVELYFLPAEGEQSNIVYEIYVNNAPIPVKVTGDTLSTNASGSFVFTITNLNMDTTYSFNIRAMQNGSKEILKLDPSKSLTTTTFKNETADFLGISSVTLSVGESGRDTVKVKWVPATIKGTNINPRITDPVAYEITYILQSEGAKNLYNNDYVSPGKKTISLPNTVANPPELNKDSEFSVTGLIPGATYFFQVRAIHKGYILYKSDSSYMREQNTRFLKITTLNNAGLFDFNGALATMTNPLGESGLTNLNVNWIPAAGEFKQYRLCFKKVANPIDETPVVDFLLDPDIDLLLSNTSACIPLDSNLTSYTIPSLTSYAYYQAKIIACKTFACELSNRIKSKLLQSRVITNITPFNGILSIANPNDETKLKEVKLNFDSPVVSAGYLNKLSLYCYNSATDTDPYSLPTDGTYSTATSKSSCDGIKVLTTIPSSLADFGKLTQMSVELPVIDGNARYCFSLLPSIQSQFLKQEDLSTAIIKCVTPEIKTPTIVQFAGRTNGCSITGKSLTVNWQSPTGGLYTKFVVLYREKQSGSNFFSFEDATDAFIANNSASTYKWVPSLARNATSHTFNNLIQGRTYNIGVLPYLEDGTTKRFAQFNVNIDDCTLPLPTPNFTEWVDIFAIGPKEDGLTPAMINGEKKFIPETLDDDGIPVDISTSAIDPKIPDLINEPLASSRLSTVQFNGVYGSFGAKESNPLYQYSNSGIVKLGWKDIDFYSGTEQMSSFINNPLYEKTPNIKTQRKFGYRVYRSDDNQMTWVDLTKNSNENKFQTISNSGLIHPTDSTWRVRNNASPNVDKIIFFTDYSVKFSGNVEEVDRARIYFYKVIPVFDGKELDYSKSGNSSHHIVKVTLPPRNMALVHRLMANRTICLEMDKDIDFKPGAHYSCSFNGMGSSSLSLPWTLGTTVYDSGGDLLIDRFELSCPFTRGDQNFVNSNSRFTSGTPTFKGLSEYGNPLKGCFHSSPGLAKYEPGTGNAVVTSNYQFKQTIPGDCFGNEAGIAAAFVKCANPLNANTRTYFFPGSNGVSKVQECGNDSGIGGVIFDLLNPAAALNTDSTEFPLQSEFAAVYYSRSSYSRNSKWDYNLGSFPGGSGTSLKQKYLYNIGSCNVNLNWANEAKEYRPRWIPVNALFGRLYTNPGTQDGLILYNKKISELLRDQTLYDTTITKAPDPTLTRSNRYNDNSTLARIVSSNSSKLPPLEGLAPKDANGICSTYKVQIGLESTSTGFLPYKTYEKRLMRKKESTVAAAWPQTYDSLKVTEIERGNFVENSIEKGCNSLSKVVPIGTEQFTKASFITTNFPHSSQLHPTLMAGSSSRDHNGNFANTEKCVSRFGVQDIVGNLQEHNSDQLFCDFTKDELYLGTAENVTNSVRVKGSQSHNYDKTQLRAWVQPVDSSGTCSVVEKGGARAGAYIVSSIFTSIYNYLGQVDPLVVSKTKEYDQNSVLTARNGDASFLDYGQENIAPKLSIKNTIATIDDKTIDADTPPFLANYFNPALGMPLVCAKGCSGEASDNTMISSDQICSNKICPGMTPSPIIRDFPMNNSRFSNVGTSDIVIGSDNSSLSIHNPGFFYASGIDLDPNPGLNSFKPLVYAPPEIISNTPGAAGLAYFSITRDSSLKMYTGGNYQRNSGRYSLHIMGNPEIEESSFTHNSGTRCAVMINEDEY